MFAPHGHAWVAHCSLVLACSRYVQVISVSHIVALKHNQNSFILVFQHTNMPKFAPVAD